TAVALDPAQKQIMDDRGETYHYSVLLLATGGTPRRLPFGDDHILYYRTLENYYHLRKLAETFQHFAIIGGGFIGSEIAAALAMQGKKVTMLIPELVLGSRVYPHGLAEFLNDYYSKKGVEILPSSTVDGFELVEERSILHMSNGKTIEADQVVAGIGIQPNVILARQAGLEIDNGIIVNEYLRTSTTDIFAAGDVASFYNPSLAKRMRVEHEDNANTMGETVGRNMAGEHNPYNHLPFFYSDLFDLGYEAVGELDSRLEIIEDWQAGFNKGVVYYLRDDRVRGVLLWNVWGKVDAARDLIAQPGPIKKNELIGRIMD
ncbi:MAG: FAD/NAD(P)-binding oxidoreductase, partial [Anaerolineaceae bacterium]|nr:FAD/NAD(P)-binding oxidoreductase [Anaerolineaceae bacterium]